MTQTLNEPYLIMAVFPARKGFGYALFEGPMAPVDWGAKETKGNRNYDALQKIARLLDFFHPDLVLLEATDGRGTKKGTRVQKLLDAIKKFLRKKGIKYASFSRQEIRECFSYSDAFSKQEIAEEIASALPEFACRLPAKRRPWQAESYSMMIFDAVALVFTFYFSEGRMTAS